MNRIQFLPVARCKIGRRLLCARPGVPPAGQPEPVSDYISHCQANGTFRTEEILVPAKMESTGAIADVRESQRWKDSNGKVKERTIRFFR